MAHHHVSIDCDSDGNDPVENDEEPADHKHEGAVMRVGPDSPGISEEHAQHAADVGDTVQEDHAVDQCAGLVPQPAKDVRVDHDNQDGDCTDEDVDPEAGLVSLVDDPFGLIDDKEGLVPGEPALELIFGAGRKVGLKHHWRMAWSLGAAVVERIGALD